GKAGRLTIRSKAADRQVSIEVADTGCGIDPEQLPRIFDPFFTTKSKAERPDMQGTGLGLAISKYIVEQAGGVLSVESTPGAGTCFSLALPLAE
ncbi:MAG: hypothetical protein GXY33_20085, partial [Phycisphaerae bacterium]|nr:hypothetical protein [Phycisphaerae bacterium]